MMEKIKTHTRLTLVVCVLLLLLAMGSAAYLAWNWPALTVGKYSYNRHAYGSIVKDIMTTDVKSRPDADKTVRQALAERAAADELALPYSNDQTSIDDAARGIYHLDDTAKVTDRERIGTYAPLIEPALTVTEAGGYHVAIINFPFSRYLTGFPGNYFGDSKLIGNVQAIRDDMSHAKAQLAKYQKEYEQGTSAERIVSDVRKDPRLVYGQTTNRSRTAFVTDTKVELEVYGSSGDIVDSAHFDRIKSQAKQLGQVRQYEETFDADAKLDYGVDMPDLSRGDMKTLVGWTLLVVDKRVDKQANIRDRYEQLVKDYVNGKK